MASKTKSKMQLKIIAMKGISKQTINNQTYVIKDQRTKINAKDTWFNE